MAPQIDPETSTSPLAAAVHAAVIAALRDNAPADLTPGDVDTLISSAEAALADYNTAVKKKNEAAVATTLARGETQRNAVESVDQVLRDLSGMQRRARTEAAQLRLHGKYRQQITSHGVLQILIFEPVYLRSLFFQHH